MDLRDPEEEVVVTLGIVVLEELICLSFFSSEYAVVFSYPELSSEM